MKNNFEDELYSYAVGTCTRIENLHTCMEIIISLQESMNKDEPVVTDYHINFMLNTLHDNLHGLNEVQDFLRGYVDKCDKNKKPEMAAV